MTASQRRALTFTWPTADVHLVRAAFIDARRVYRQPAPGEFSLTLSSFTQTAYGIARRRIDNWQKDVLEAAHTARVRDREALALSWEARVAADLDDDWDSISAEAVRMRAASTQTTTGIPRAQVHKSEVARTGVLLGIQDWPSWIRSAPNDSRRAARPPLPS